MVYFSSIIISTSVPKGMASSTSPGEALAKCRPDSMGLGTDLISTPWLPTFQGRSNPETGRLVRKTSWVGLLRLRVPNAPVLDSETLISVQHNHKKPKKD